MARLSRPLGRVIDRSAQALFLPIRAVADIRCATRFETFCRTRFRWSAAIAQSVEHVIRNDGVGGSNPSCGTILKSMKKLAKASK